MVFFYWNSNVDNEHQVLDLFLRNHVIGEGVLENYGDNQNITFRDVSEMDHTIEIYAREENGCVFRYRFSIGNFQYELVNPREFFEMVRNSSIVVPQRYRIKDILRDVHHE